MIKNKVKKQKLDNNITINGHHSAVIVKLLKKHDVKKASLFGSYARGEATKGSDVDFLVEFKGRKSLLDLVALEYALKDFLRKDVDVITYNSLHHLIRDRVLNEQIRIL